jgi:sensor c-di-GMP phosphodiesterase-like protein
MGSEMLSRLKQALLTDNILLKYQPIYASTCNKIIGFETLLRWRDPHFGRICPERLVQLAAENGLMNALSVYVVRKALSEIAVLVNQHSLLLSINISPNDLLSSSFNSLLFKEITAFKISPASIMLEITEVPCKYPDKIIKKAEQLAAEGFRLALDDFGKGCSNIDRLLSLPISDVKIDRALTHALMESGTTSDKVRKCCENLYQQAWRLIFEGVETAAHSHFLHVHFPHALQQGWYFSKAVPMSGVRALLGEPEA